MAFDRKNEKSFDSISNNNLSRPSKKFHSKKRHSNNPIIKDKDGGGVPIGNKFDYSSWSLSADEDYILFCFAEVPNRKYFVFYKFYLKLKKKNYILFINAKAHDVKIKTPYIKP